MISSLNFTKFWGIFFLDLKYFKSKNLFFLKNLNIKTKLAASTNDFLGSSNISLALSRKFYCASRKLKFNFLISHYKTFFFCSEVFYVFSLNVESTNVFYVKKKLTIHLKSIDLFYLNSNLFFSNYFLRTNYKFYFKININKQLLLSNFFAFRGFPKLQI